MLHGASGGPSRASTSLRVGWLCSRRPIRSDAICPRGLSGSQLPRHLLHKAWSKDALSNGSVGLSQRSHRAMAPTIPQTTISSFLRDARIADSEPPNDLVERPRAGAHDRAVYRSRPLQRRVRWRLDLIKQVQRIIQAYPPACHAAKHSTASTALTNIQPLYGTW